MDKPRFLEVCRSTREDIIRLYLNADGGHLGAALSTVEILVTLYHSIMKLPANHLPGGTPRDQADRFLLSKGHGALALYAVLGRLGYFPREEWERISRPEGILGGHPSGHVPGVEISTGSLGLAPSVAVGIAANARLRNLPYRTFCLLGDGECNEGSVWEAALSAAQRRLHQLYFLIDANGRQAFGKTSDVWNLEPLREKWAAFGFQAFDLDLRAEPTALLALLTKSDFAHDRPVALICRTSKTGGLALDADRWHHKNKLSAEDRQFLQTLIGGSA